MPATTAIKPTMATGNQRLTVSGGRMARDMTMAKSPQNIRR
jgi:hypothetical protein